MTPNHPLRRRLRSLSAAAACAISAAVACSSVVVSPAASAAESARTAAPASAGAAPKMTPPGCPPLLDHRFARLQDDSPQHLCDYAGRVLLVVNTASFCGFTEQYQDLEQLYRRYRARGFEVLGFPSNDFGEQEPGTNRQIAALCFDTYGVAFPMFAKTAVRGADANPLYARLAADAGPPQWNFHKYLIGRDGRVIASWRSSVRPLDPRLTTALERALAER